LPLHARQAAVWEACLPPGARPAAQAASNEEHLRQRRPFIRDKYERMKYYRPAPPSQQQQQQQQQQAPFKQQHQHQQVAPTPTLTPTVAGLGAPHLVAVGPGQHQPTHQQAQVPQVPPPQMHHQRQAQIGAQPQPQAQPRQAAGQPPNAGTAVCAGTGWLGGAAEEGSALSDPFASLALHGATATSSRRSNVAEFDPFA